MGEPRGYRLLDAEIRMAPDQADGRRGYYRVEREGEVRGIVVRVVPAGAGDSAERRADGYLTGREASSVHAVIDAVGVVPMLPDDHVAVAAGASDATSLVIDLVWHPDDPEAGYDALANAAGWCAERIRAHAIAIRRCARTDWDAGRSGLIGADELGAGGRSDGFPWDELLDEIRAAAPRRPTVAGWWQRGGGSRAAVTAAAAVVLVVAGIIGLVVVGGSDSDDGADGDDGAGSVDTAAAPTTVVTTTTPLTTPPPATTTAPTTAPATTLPPTTVPPTTEAFAASTTVAAPVPTVPALNLSGFWDLEVDVVAATASCAEAVDEPPSSRRVFVLHDGDEVSVIGLGNDDTAWQGTFDGSDLVFGGSRGEDGGTWSALFVLGFDRSAEQLVGEEFWSWSGGPLSCPDGRSEVVAVRVDLEADSAAEDDAAESDG